MPYILAIDPGGTSGLAFRLPDGRILTHKVNQQESLWAYFMPDMPKLDHVIVEEWQYFSGVATPAGVFTASLVSSVRGICYVQNIPLSLRTPQSRKDKIPAAKKWLKENKPGHVIHEVDALAHLLTYEDPRARPRR